MDKISNPWTKIQRVKGEGMLNSIMTQSFEEQNQSIHYLTSSNKDSPLQYGRTLKKIKKKFKPQNSIKQFKQFLSLKKKCEKLDEILEWIEKIENKDSCTNSQRKVKQNDLSPLDSSFFYLPLYSGTIFHEILKQCTIKDKQRNIGEYKNSKLKQSIEQINSFQSLQEALISQIL